MGIRSLKRGIKRILCACDNSSVPSTGEIAEFAYEQVECLEEIAGTPDSSDVEEGESLEEIAGSLWDPRDPSQVRILRRRYGCDTSLAREIIADSPWDPSYVGEAFSVEEIPDSLWDFSSVDSLQLRILRRLYSCDNSLVREFLESAYVEVESLQEIAIRVRKRRESRLVTDIEDAASGLNQGLDSYVSEPNVLQSESHGDEIIQISIGINLKQEIHSFSERVKTMEARMKEYDADPPRIDSGGGLASKMVGLSDLRRELVLWARYFAYNIVAIYGMAGIGKSTLAMEVFDDRLSLGIDFHCRAWVTVGQNPQLEEIIRSILDQVNPDGDKMLMEQSLKDCLRDRRYLIVLDDVWDEWVEKKIVSLLPANYNSSMVLLTTRREEVASQIDYITIHHKPMKMRLLDKEESWILLREKIFGEQLCPSHLEKAGRKIAERCDSLPLTIVTIANLLSKGEKTLQYWNEVAAKKNHQIFMVAYDKISEVLLPSYRYLNKNLQLCFLYMGVFPPNYKIRPSKLINMWCTDRSLGQILDKFSNDDVMKCLNELVSDSLVMVYQSTIYCKGNAGIPRKYSREIKTCGLHSSFWHLSNREAEKTKFCCVLNSLKDALGEGIKRQCRLSFHNNILFSIKDVCMSVKKNCSSTAHSLLFYGPYHQYQVPVYFGLDSLRQLDAHTIRFYEFPKEILQLFQLRYLALTVNGELPPSISQLLDLQFLIVGRHMSIKSYPSYLPVEIWNMKELQHLQVMGCDLRDPPCGTSLKNLSTLSNVSLLSCTQSILKAIPNLEKLGIRIELASNGHGKQMSCLDDELPLRRLKSVKCVIENPKFAPPVALHSILSSCLQKLSLSGLGYSWEEMGKLSLLKSLEELTLRNYAFRGAKWELEREFGLTSLVIEDTDVEEWNIGFEGFRFLRYLSIRHCYKLEKIHGHFGFFLEKIELVDCNPLGVKQMKKIIKRWTEIDINSSWNDLN